MLLSNDAVGPKWSKNTKDPTDRHLTWGRMRRTVIPGFNSRGSPDTTLSVEKFMRRTGGRRCELTRGITVWVKATTIEVLILLGVIHLFYDLDECVVHSTAETTSRETTRV